MSLSVLAYLAHPLGGDVPGNLALAKRWLCYVYRRYPAWVVIAPWAHDVEVIGHDDANPVDREHGLRRDEFVVARCDALILCGGRLSSGMARELAVAQERGLSIVDLIPLGEEPPQ